jgi:uncharacterized protein YjiS (DUF1127 family)
MTKLVQMAGAMPSGSNMRDALRSGAGGLWARFRTWRLQRATATSLSGLNDFQLKDLGLHRSEIGTVARGPADNPRYRRR